MHTDVMLGDSQAPEMLTGASPSIIKRSEHKIAPPIRHNLIITCRGVEDFAGCQRTTIRLTPQNGIT